MGTMRGVWMGAMRGWRLVLIMELMLMSKAGVHRLCLAFQHFEGAIMRCLMTTTHTAHQTITTLPHPPHSTLQHATARHSTPQHSMCSQVTCFSTFFPAVPFRFTAFWGDDMSPR